MDHTTSQTQIDYQGPTSPWAIVMLVLAALGLCYAFVTLAVPGAGQQLIADTCALVHGGDGASGLCQEQGGNPGKPPVIDAAEQAMSFHSAYVSIADQPKPEELPLTPAGGAMSTADDHLAIAQSFNAAIDRSTLQVPPRPELIVQVPAAGNLIALR